MAFDTSKEDGHDPIEGSSPSGSWDILKNTNPQAVLDSIPPEAKGATKVKEIVSKMIGIGELFSPIETKGNLKIPQLGPVTDALFDVTHAVNRATLDGTRPFDEQAFVNTLSISLQTIQGRLEAEKETGHFLYESQEYYQTFNDEVGPLIDATKALRNEMVGGRKSWEDRVQQHKEFFLKQIEEDTIQS